MESTQTKIEVGMEGHTDRYRLGEHTDKEKKKTEERNRNGMNKKITHR